MGDCANSRMAEDEINTEGLLSASVLLCAWVWIEWVVEGDETGMEFFFIPGYKGNSGDQTEWSIAIRMIRCNRVLNSSSDNFSGALSQPGLQGSMQGCRGAGSQNKTCVLRVLECSGVPLLVLFTSV